MPQAIGCYWYVALQNLIYVKGGIVTWETQQTDYPRTRWDMPNHEPRGCSRGACYSWDLYRGKRLEDGRGGGGGVGGGGSEYEW